MVQERITIWQKLHIDLPLLIGLTVLAVVGLFVIYSASGQDMALIQRQLVRLGLATVTMFVLAQVPPLFWQKFAPYLYIGGLILLVAVLVVGTKGKGAQRWLDLGVTRFQPSELMKMAVPLMAAWFISRFDMPVLTRYILVGFCIVIVPTLLIARQPDLGTSILIASSGLFVLFLAGMSLRLVGSLAVIAPIFGFVLWQYFMHDYQKQRVLTFLDPESDPLGAGYHIIQSKIAIGSGGIAGKGWLQGTQSQLDFLPERHTDFIFAVFSEEFGLIGVFLLLVLYLYIVARGLVIANRAQDAFTKLLAGALTLTFFVYVFVNIGMVSGILPVVGVPLPLVSYGGTSMVTLMASFGILMGIATQRRMLAR